MQHLLQKIGDQIFESVYSQQTVISCHLFMFHLPEILESTISFLFLSLKVFNSVEVEQERPNGNAHSKGQNYQHTQTKRTSSLFPNQQEGHTHTK